MHLAPHPEKGHLSRQQDVRVSSLELGGVVPKALYTHTHTHTYKHIYLYVWSLIHISPHP